MPTQLHSSADGRDQTLAFSVDDGPGKMVQSQERWQLSADGTILRVGQGPDLDEMKVVESRPLADGFTLVADGQGRENGKDVRTRTILTRRGDVLSIARLTGLPSQPLLMRHAYRLVLLR
jgi:hypothetical protein